MNLWQFYKDNPTLLEAKVGDELANIAAIVDGTTKKALNVFVDGGSVTTDPIATSFLVVGSALNVPASTLTTITTYTAASAKKITQISVSGQVYGKFQLFKNTVLFETRRTSPERSLDFMFNSPLTLMPGDVLDVKVTHFQIGELSDFESTVYGV